MVDTQGAYHLARRQDFQHDRAQSREGGAGCGAKAGGNTNLRPVGDTAVVDDLLDDFADGARGETDHGADCHLSGEGTDAVAGDGRRADAEGEGADRDADDGGGDHADDGAGGWCVAGGVGEVDRVADGVLVRVHRAANGRVGLQPAAAVGRVGAIAEDRDRRGEAQG